MALQTADNSSSKLYSAFEQMGYTYKNILDMSYSVERGSDLINSTFHSELSILKWRYQEIFGSQLDGSTIPPCSDVDYVQVDRRFQYLELKDGAVELNEQKPPPGHVFVKFDSHLYVIIDETFYRDSLLAYQVVRVNEAWFWSSEKYMAFQKTDRHTERHGPAYQGEGVLTRFLIIRKFLRLISRNLNLDKVIEIYRINDNVSALQYHCPYILRRRRLRPRYHGWPTQDVIEQVCSLTAFLVPVSENNTENANLQWRICFNVAETVLIRSLNDVQLKLYIILKLVRQFCLKHISKDVSSFVLKNIVLWMAENIPQQLFVPELLIDRIRDALQMLKRSIEQKRLDYYMIPERNLFKNKLSKEQQQQLVSELNRLVSMSNEQMLNFLTHTNGTCSFISKLPEYKAVERVVTLFYSGLTVKRLTCLIKLIYLSFSNTALLDLNISVYLIFTIARMVYTYGGKCLTDPFEVGMKTSINKSPLFDFHRYRCEACRVIALSACDEIAVNHMFNINLNWKRSCQVHFKNISSAPERLLYQGTPVSANYLQHSSDITERLLYQRTSSANYLRHNSGITERILYQRTPASVPDNTEKTEHSLYQTALMSTNWLFHYKYPRHTSDMADSGILKRLLEYVSLTLLQTALGYQLI